MTFVYHVETHRNPRQIESLVRAIVRAAPDSLVVVDHDRSFESPDPSVLARLGAELRLSDGGYGDMTHVNRWLSTVHWLQAEGVAYDYLSNLSGQDYPIRPVDQIHSEVAGSGIDAFIETFSVLDPTETTWGVPRGRTRYEFGHRRLSRLRPWQQQALRPAQAINKLQPWLRLTTSTGLMVGRRADGPWSDDLVLRGGSFFCTLSTAAVGAVLRFADERPDVADYLTRCITPEEVYFQTALGWAVENDDESRTLAIENNCRRYFDFSESKFNHPRTFDRADLPVVLASDADFARKFDEARYPGVLSLVDAHLEQASAGPSQPIAVAG